MTRIDDRKAANNAATILKRVKEEWCFDTARLKLHSECRCVLLHDRIGRVFGEDATQDMITRKAFKIIKPRIESGLKGHLRGNSCYGFAERLLTELQRIDRFKIRPWIVPHRTVEVEFDDITLHDDLLLNGLNTYTKIIHRPEM